MATPEFKRAPVSKRTKMDTLIINKEVLKEWKLPPFQRPLRVTPKVEEIADLIKSQGGVIPGVLTLGVIESGREKGTYLLDGQHRVEAFRISGIEDGLADVRIVEHEDMADMGQEFVELNSQIVRMRPDDVLRGLESSLEDMKRVKESCPFVGYDNVRRSTGNAKTVVSMSAVLRVWSGSGSEAPQADTTGAAHLAKSLTTESADYLIEFLILAHEAWGREPDSFRMWSNLNLCLCMWLYRRMILLKEHNSQKRYSVITRDQFKKCLMALAANEDYSDWLVGRIVSERDRAPAYNRLRAIFVKRLETEGVPKPKLPNAPWVTYGKLTSTG